MIPAQCHKSLFSAARRGDCSMGVNDPDCAFLPGGIEGPVISLPLVALTGLGAATYIMASIADLPLTPSISSHLINPAFNN